MQQQNSLSYYSNMYRKILSLLTLILVSIVCREQWTFTSASIYTDTSRGIIYQYEGTTASVYGYTESVASTVSIPATVKIDNRTYSVKSIYPFAFNGCTRLNTLSVAASLDSVGMHAFELCTSLTKVTLTFCKRIGEFAFNGDGQLKTLILPQTTLKEIDDYAFSLCTSLSAVTLPNTLTTLGHGVFYGCGLTSVTLPNSLTEIPDYTFFDCLSLKEILLPNSIERIGKWALANCRITTVKWPDSLSSIGDHALSNTASSPIVLPQGVSEAGGMVFSHLANLPVIYAYSNSLLSTTTFAGTDFSNTTLYVLPSLLEDYRTSHSALFKEILPLGDINGDKTYDVSDVINLLVYIRKSGTYALEQCAPNYRDVNGDGIINSHDAKAMAKDVLNISK